MLILILGFTAEYFHIQNIFPNVSFFPASILCFTLIQIYLLIQFVFHNLFQAETELARFQFENKELNTLIKSRYNEFNHEKQEQLKMIEKQTSTMRTSLSSKDAELAQLISYKDQIALENETKSQFLQEIQPELTSKLKYITNLAENLLQKLLSKTEKNSIVEIKENSDHLLTLSKLIRSLEQYHSHNLKNTQSMTNTTEITSHIKPLLKKMLLKKPVTFFVKTYIPQTQTIQVNISLLKTILTNLIHNACKYTTKGEITLRIFPQNQKLFFEISDTGIGIPKGELENIYLPYYRLQNQINLDNPGLGLGLAICKKFLRKLNGSIEISSTYKKGSKFTFSIPFQKVPS